MLVSDILKNKGSRVITARLDETAASIASLFRAKRIAAAVVLDRRGEVTGMISERDIVTQVAARGEEALGLPASAFMSTRFPTCKPEDKIKDVMAVMTHRRIRHLPVMEGRKLCGIVSIGDIVKSHLDETQLELGVLRDYARTHGT